MADRSDRTGHEVLALVGVGAALALVANQVIAVGLWSWILFAVLLLLVAGLGFYNLRRRRSLAARAAIERRSAMLAVLPPTVVSDDAGIQRPSSLLSAERAIAPFRAFQSELKELNDWVDSQTSSTLFVLSGPALVGKTRLTIELSKALSPRWQVGRLRPGMEQHGVASILEVPGFHLIVIELCDSVGGLTPILDDVVGHRSDRLKVLLVARSQRWITTRINDAQELTKLAVIDAQHLANGGLYPQGVETDLSRWSRQAEVAFAAELSCPPPRTSELKPAVGTPIGLVQANALARVLSTIDMDGEGKPARAAEVFIAHETRHWPALAGSNSGNKLDLRVFSAAWLFEPKEGPAVREALKRIPELADVTDKRIDQVTGWLSDVNGGYASVVCASEIVFNEIAISMFTGDNDFLKQLTAHLNVGQLSLTIARLLTISLQIPRSTLLATKCLQWREQGLDDVELSMIIDNSPNSRCTDDFLAAVLEQHPPAYPAALDLLEQLESHQGLEYACIAVRMALLSHLRSDGEVAAAAHQLDILVEALTNLVRYEEARRLCGEAVDLYRELEVDDPKFSVDIAKNLGLLTKLLTDLGLWEDALPHALEAVDRYQELLDIDPVMYGSVSAESLRAVASILFRIGRHNEALPYGDLSVRRWRDLASKNPTYKSGLARALVETGRNLVVMDRPDDAFALCGEAVRLFRETVAHSPAADSSSNLGWALDHLADVLWEMGRYDEALNHTVEASVLLRELNGGEYFLHKRRLTRVLNSLGANLAFLGRSREGLPHSIDAVELYRELVDIHPRQYTGELALALTNLSATLGNLGRHGKAVSHSFEAVKLFRKLATEEPHLHESGLARALNNYGNDLGSLGSHEAARESYLQAIDLYRPLAVANPARHDPDLAMALCNLGAALARLERSNEALPLLIESTRLYHRWLAADSARSHPGVRAAEINLRTVLTDLGLNDAVALGDLPVEP